MPDYLSPLPGAIPPGEFAALATPTPSPYVDPNALERKKAAADPKDEKAAEAKASRKEADAPRTVADQKSCDAADF